jgi:hypothetical protein
MTYPVKVTWYWEAVNHDAIESRAVYTWNEICARIMERFGLPGGKYTTDVTEDFMIFHFNDQEDAFLSKLMIGDYGRDGGPL